MLERNTLAKMQWIEIALRPILAHSPSLRHQTDSPEIRAQNGFSKKAQTTRLSESSHPDSRASTVRRPLHTMRKTSMFQSIQPITTSPTIEGGNSFSLAMTRPTEAAPAMLLSTIHLSYGFHSGSRR